MEMDELMNMNVEDMDSAQLRDAVRYKDMEESEARGLANASKEFMRLVKHNADAIREILLVGGRDTPTNLATMGDLDSVLKLFSENENE